MTFIYCRLVLNIKFRMDKHTDASGILTWALQHHIVGQLTRQAFKHIQFITTRMMNIRPRMTQRQRRARSWNTDSWQTEMHARHQIAAQTNQRSMTHRRMECPQLSRRRMRLAHHDTWGLNHRTTGRMNIRALDMMHMTTQMHCDHDSTRTPTDIPTHGIGACSGSPRNHDEHDPLDRDSTNIDIDE